MENEVFREFKLKLGPDVVISNYWRLNFTLFRAMCEWESFGEMVKLTVSMFKEDAESNLGHMQEVIHLSKPPFQRQQRTKEGATSKSNDEEAESVMRD